ncbi:hypothetical protein KP509_23G039500 [Ceratopteris richardii]|nr:hypothetical protein KP509_23G039500 [Ceratopteris richardii]
MLAYVLTVLACFGLIIVVTIFVLPEGRKAFFVGTLAAVLNTAMYAAPLSIMRHVIVTKSVAAMPFLLSLCTFFNSCFWAVYGFLKKDTFIIIPNILGVILAAAQLVLYAYYHNYEKKHPTKDVSNGNLPNVKRLETVQQV